MAAGTKKGYPAIGGLTLDIHGAETQNRTGDTRIFSPLLYRLSYLGATVNFTAFYSLLYILENKKVVKPFRVLTLLHRFLQSYHAIPAYSYQRLSTENLY